MERFYNNYLYDTENSELITKTNAKDPAPNYKTYCKLFGTPENDQ